VKIHLLSSKTQKFSSKKESLAKEICAFSNGSGGVILLGVDDSGEIAGLKDNFNYEEWIMNISRDLIVPSANVNFSISEVSNKKIGIIEVNKGQNNHYDLIPVENTSIRVLNSSYLSDYFSKYSIDYEQESEADRLNLLINTDILGSNGNCTVAGLLLFGIKPQKYLLNASISIARFKGNDIGDELIDKQVVEGTLGNQIDISTAIIKNLIPVSSTIEGNKRIDKKHSYSDRLLREIIVNAVVHRNYSIVGSRIRVLIFDNRLEVISPGRLPNTITTEKIRYGVSYAVNPVLVKFMENMRYIDKLGRGIPMVCQEVEKANRKIDFIEVGQDFKVVLEL
jgi:ATP-dependent DNA helicase RecG